MNESDEDSHLHHVHCVGKCQQGQCSDVVEDHLVEILQHIISYW